MPDGTSFVAFENGVLLAQGNFGNADAQTVSGEGRYENVCLQESDTPRRAGGLMGWAASKAVTPKV